MVDIFKTLDGKTCLGEKISCRKLGEETTRTHAIGAVAALKALDMIIGQKPTRVQDATQEQEDEQDDDVKLGPQTLETKTTSLSTLQQSRIIKISGIYDRERVMTVEDYEELKDNFEAEMQNIGQLRNIKVVRNGEEKLGAEVGSIFVEFKD